MALIYNATFDKNTRKLSFEDRAGNEIYSFTVPERGPAVDDITKPLTFKATKDGSIVSLWKHKQNDGDFQTSRDGGNTWEDYTLDTNITLNNGDEVSFRVKKNRSPYQYAMSPCKFGIRRGKIEAWHNVMSMYRKDDFATYDTAVGSVFAYLFENCTSLTKAPVLPATILADSCYIGMFSGCQSLTKAPELPATTLAINCYKSMFSGCQSLTKAPELPATTLYSNCYQYMFSGCQSLKEVRVSATTTATDALKEWLKDVSATGDFYCDPNATIFPTDSASGIPSGWRRTPPVDDITKPLTFKATQDGSTVKLKRNGTVKDEFQTSRDGGKTWVDYTWADYTMGTAIALNTGDEVSFRAKADRSAQTVSGYLQFVMTGKIEAWHNVMSMYRKDDFATYDTAMDFSFYRLFQHCTSLTKAPVLPATTLAGSCYYDMFGGCQSLTKAPELPATTLAQSCYNGIFYNCSSLTKAPALPATTLADDCYGYMFYNCSRLNEVHCQMPSSYSSSQIPSYTKDWLSGVSFTGKFYTNADANWSTGASGIPEGWTRVNEEAPVDDITKPLTFKTTQDGSTVSLSKRGSPSGAFQTSRDGGNTWSDYTIDTAITLNTGDEVSFRAKANRTSNQASSHYFYFTMMGKIEAWHNVMSMYRTSDFATYESVVEYAFYHLFEGCTSLVKAPVLPATTLDYCCYNGIFYNCSSLTKAPELPATTLANYCYTSMFYGCQSLTKAPVLPATTLTYNCYKRMFYGCQSLAKAPELPATKLYESCCEDMFHGCRSLTKAPALPATTLANSCYYKMFEGCQSLKEVRVSATTTAQNALIDWLFNVSSTGDFYCDPNATIFPTNNTSGIPENWRRLNIADYPVTP